MPLTFTDCAAILNSLHKQVTGHDSITPTSTAEFMSVASTLCEQGLDPVMNAITQMVHRTVFSVRPYSRKFASLRVNEQEFAQHVRKITILDKPAEADQRFSAEAITDGQSVDMYKVNKPVAMQTNFYGGDTRQRHYTVYRDQLNTAFKNPEEFNAFLSAVVQNNSDIIEQESEALARATVANFIAGKSKMSGNGVVHLLSEYKTATGVELNTTTMRSPANYAPFVKWAMARIRSISDLMTERSLMYHQNPNGKAIPRHTPLDKQRLYIHAPHINEMETSVFADTYHAEYLKKIGDFERVNFWQSITTPGEISVKPMIMDADGVAKAANENIVVSSVFGLLADVEAFGYTHMNNWASCTPLNSAGGYWNMFHHWTERHWNDFTENGVLFLLD